MARCWCFTTVRMTFAPAAKFVRRYAEAGSLIREAVEHFKADVEAGTYPTAGSYHLPRETKAELEALLRRKQLKAYAR